MIFIILATFHDMFLVSVGWLEFILILSLIVSDYYISIYFVDFQETKCHQVYCSMQIRAKSISLSIIVSFRIPHYFLALQKYHLAKGSLPHSGLRLPILKMNLPFCRIFPPLDDWIDIQKQTFLFARLFQCIFRNIRLLHKV